MIRYEKYVSVATITFAIDVATIDLIVLLDLIVLIVVTIVALNNAEDS